MPAYKVKLKMEPVWVQYAVGVSLAAPLVAETTRSTLNRARITAPRKTGNLADSQQMAVRARRQSVTGTISTKVKYALPVHEGHRMYSVRPVRAGALVFNWAKIGGMRTIVPKKRGGPSGVMLSKRYGAYYRIGKGYVVIPAAKGRPWLFDSLRDVAEPAGFIVRRVSGGTVLGL